MDELAARLEQLEAQVRALAEERSATLPRKAGV
jgi:hypothetical protein